MILERRYRAMKGVGTTSYDNIEKCRTPRQMSLFINLLKCVEMITKGYVERSRD